MKNAAPLSRRAFWKVLGCLAFSFFAAFPAFAAGTLICTVGGTAPAATSCLGTGWTAFAEVDVWAAGTDACSAGGTAVGSFMADDIGEFPATAGNALADAGNWYLYGTEDGCLTSAAEAANPHVVSEAEYCGDGVVQSGETCDDGNVTNGDGCSDACTVESGWTCDGQSPTSCYQNLPPNSTLADWLEYHKTALTLAVSLVTVIIIGLCL